MAGFGVYAGVDGGRVVGPKGTSSKEQGRTRLQAGRGRSNNAFVEEVLSKTLGARHGEQGGSSQNHVTRFDSVCALKNLLQS
jgi:hypothetical protein